jgi:pilus assembly protein CpaB
LILLVGIFLAVGAFILIVFLNAGGAPRATPTPAVAHMVVAAVDIPQGTSITESMLTTKDVNLAEKPADSFALTASVVGKTARQSIAAGAYLPQSAISGTGVSTSVDVAGELKPGERAMAISVDEVNGVGTLIQPGDRVDVVIAFIKDADRKPEIPETFVPPRNVAPPSCDKLLCEESAIGINVASTKVVIQNLRVVGILLSGPASPQGGAQASPAPAAGPILTGRTELVMLAVSDQQAEVLRFGQLLSSPITLILRAPADAEASPEDTTGIVLKVLIEEYGVLPPEPIFVPLGTDYVPR